MRRTPWALMAILLLGAALGLGACDTAEERAEGHYQRGMALLEEGDVSRAMVEFRNVFRLDGNHGAARLAYADQLVAMGEIGEAIGQYLRLVEQDWSNVEGHKRLTELALSIQDFDTAATHSRRAHELAPEDPEVRAFKATVDYRWGYREEAVTMARGVLEERPENLPARMVLIADRVNAEDFAAARAMIDTALAAAPEDEGVHFFKLAVLERQGDTAGVGAQLARMAELFPGNEAIADGLIRWHLQEGDPERAEALMRARVAAAPEGRERTDAALTLVRLVDAYRGREAARAELEDRIAAAPDGAAALPFRRALAGLDIDEGHVERAIAALEALVAQTEPSDARRDTQVLLAGVHGDAGRTDAADALVEAVLAEDAGHVGALKLRAKRLIDTDRPDEAIRDLRTALNQEPRDPDILTLMAVAHERAGARALAGERLALAVEVSNRRPAEAIRYARFLMADGRPGPAEAVVTESLRVHPDDPDLLLALGQIHVERRDWDRAQRIIDRLRALDGPGAAAFAATLEAGALRGQSRFEEMITMIEGLADQGGDRAGDSRATAGVVQTYLMAGNLAGARSYVDAALERDRGDPGIRLIEAGLMVLAGETVEAEEAYRAILADESAFAPAYEALYGLLVGTGRGEEASALLEAGMAATADDPRLMFVAAGEREVQGDFEGAIAIYEDLYARDTASVLIANNLASLIATHRDDADSLARAFAIARRLHGTEVPQFADTYGWILSRRGEYEEALPYLERAAVALPDDPLVQYHLGVTQYRAGRAEEAQQSLDRALGAAGHDSTLPQITEARTILSAIAESAEVSGAEN
jgi:tetratricopeptide (TPR) repeat protein